MRTARWIELEGLSPRELHAAYIGLAEALPAGGAPIVLWARCAMPHVSLSETRSPALELDLAACRALGVEVIARPLGGGAVLVDGWQQALFFLLPPGAGGGGLPPPRAFMGRALETLARTYRRFGIAAEVQGTDVVGPDGAKLSGSGAATLGTTLVFGSSFIERFDHDLFCRLIRVPSEGFRGWLREALVEGFRAWPDAPAWPGKAALHAVLREELAASLGWSCLEDEPRPEERAAIAQACEALGSQAVDPGPGGGRRHVPGGVKINAGMFLTESRDDRGWLRVLTRGGRIARLAAEDEAVSARLQCCLGQIASAPVLQARLAKVFMPCAGGGNGEAAYWARRIESTAVTEMG